MRQERAVSVEDVFPLPRQLVGDGELFVLKVVGDSMIEAAICDGDWVTVRRQPVAENGDIVAAMLDGEATVKRFKREDGHVWLLPHNAALARDDRGRLSGALDASGVFASQPRATALGRQTACAARLVDQMVRA
ncbi:hypothetical protein Shyd_86110 [Streptomyces hydrogenans]|uniref:Peptidase S24/S26A/S26B/S26C domain-containing protein n=1 Tax=Streptomyces hydrogenans TaxID=1873719 RepID=A0ABQ3PQD1_9ACTN|nr:hypothetical protein GCM10018784_74170 [Streptomyces hydrogenans]GHI27240.1 hypothetical protein Shyd_86110 [Streptomyces hydrogenans]